MPSERAKAAGAPVEVDISKLEMGQKVNVEWRGKPVWVVKRTKEMIDNLPKLDGELADPKSDSSDQPDYAKNAARALKPEIWVATGVCTHLAVRRPIVLTWHPPIWARAGWVATTAPVMAPSTTSQVVFTRVCRHR